MQTTLTATVSHAVWVKCQLDVSFFFTLLAHTRTVQIEPCCFFAVRVAQECVRACVREAINMGQQKPIATDTRIVNKIEHWTYYYK